MASIHLLNVAPGDCTIIRHNSGRVSMIDICDGYVAPIASAARMPTNTGQTGNYRMCRHPTNPLFYARDLGIHEIWRFVLTHPDMDHMDGFNRLVDAFPLHNYWDTGSRRTKPIFERSPYNETDWNRYVLVRDGLERGIHSLLKRAGSRFSYANECGADGSHDGFYILAPNAALVDDPGMNDDVNDGSYVILYKTQGGRVLLPGDAHDNTWAYIRRHSPDDVHGAAFLLAPHHGRDSDRSYDFLDLVRPSLTLIGCAPSEYIDYSQWERRGLDYITSNQCGSVVIEAREPTAETGPYLAVYVENIDFAVTKGGGEPVNEQGYGCLTTIGDNNSL